MRPFVKKRADLQNDNRGLSLVELIVAISIGVIVAGSIAGLMTFAIRTYRNESVNTSMQYELQTNINMMMDEIMSSASLVVVQNSAGSEPYTKYAMFGIPSPNASVGFEGVIFVPITVSPGKFNIYMKKVERAIPNTADDGTDIKTVADLAKDEYALMTKPSADNTAYLLGENATKFDIIPDPNGKFEPTEYTYTNPIDVKVELQFEKNGWGGKVYSKHVDDVAYLRNKVTETVYGTAPSVVIDGNVYVGGTAYTPKD